MDKTWLLKHIDSRIRKDDLLQLLLEVPPEYLKIPPSGPKTRSEIETLIKDARARYWNSQALDPPKRHEVEVPASEVNSWLKTLPNFEG